MVTVAGVDVPAWCLGAVGVLTPAAVCAYWVHRSRQRALLFAETPQLEQSSLLLGSLPEFVLVNHPDTSNIEVPKRFKQLGLTWGVRFPTWLFGNRDSVLFTADPEIIREIQSKKSIFHSRPSHNGFPQTVPSGLLSLRATGPQSQWALHRRLVSPLFSDRFLEGYSAEVSATACQLRHVLLESMNGTEMSCDMQHCLKLATLDVISKIGFGYPSSAVATLLPSSHPAAMSKLEAIQELNFSEAANILLEETQRRVEDIRVLRFWPPRYWRYCWAHRMMNRRIRQVLRSQDREDAKNMLKALVGAHENDQKLSAHELQDEIKTLLVAGHETTGYTTSWALYEVAQDEEVQKKILDETKDLDLDTMVLTKVEPLLPYTWRCWQEALRMHPTVPLHVRVAEEDTKLGGKFFVPRGTAVIISQLQIAHSEEIWGKDVMEYKPSRMERVPDVHMPFGFGGRTCIGKRLAYAEGVYLLAFIVKNFHLKLQDGAPKPSHRATITNHSKEGIFLTVSKR